MADPKPIDAAELDDVLPPGSRLYIKEWREFRGYRVSQFAAACGLTRQALYFLETLQSRRPHRPTLQEISQVLKVHLVELYYPPSVKMDDSSLDSD